MDAPTAGDIRAWAPPDMKWSTFGFPDRAPSAPATDPLPKRVEWACAYLEQVTWRPLSSILPEQPIVPAPIACAFDPCGLDSAPQGEPTINLQPLAEQALLMRVLQIVMQSSTRYVSATVMQDYVQSFTAGSYSEQRRTADEIVRGRGGFVANPQVNPWRELSDLLWMLMTNDAFYWWKAKTTGQQQAAGAFASGDWGSSRDSLVGIPGIVGAGVIAWP